MITVKEIYAECIVVIRTEDLIPRFVLLVKTHGRKWSFPKVKLQTGENVEHGAIRALLVKTGIKAALKRKIEDRIYWYSNKTADGQIVRILKKVYFFYFELPPSAVAELHQKSAEWIPVKDAEALLSNEGEKKALQHCLQIAGIKGII